MAIKGFVDESKLPPIPDYEYFSNGEYLNPQTHPIFLFLRDNHFSWYLEWTWEWVMKDGKEITLVGIEKNLLKNIFHNFFDRYTSCSTLEYDFMYHIYSHHNFKQLEQIEIGRTFELKRWQTKKEIIV